MILSAVVGTLSAALVVAWVPNALRALGSSDATAFLGLVVTAGWAKGPLFATMGLIAHELDRFPVPWRLLAFGAAFGFGEWVVSTASWGVPGALLGHSQRSALGVAQLAVVGGVPFISAWLAALNLSIALAFSGVRMREAGPLVAALAAGWLAAWAVGLPVAQLARPEGGSGRTVNLLIVQPDIPRSARWDTGAQAWILEQISRHTHDALARAPGPIDAVVWPENLLTTPLEIRPQLARQLRDQVDGWGTALILGAVRPPQVPHPRRYRSSVLWLEPERGVTAHIDKERAVPLLESGRSVPGDRWLTPLFGGAARWPRVEEAPQAGPLAGRFTVTPVLCYEALFPAIVAHRRTAESVAILNLADDSWVEGTAATQQLTAWTAFRAIEQRLPLIRVAHGGLSAVVDAFGRTTTTLPLDRFADRVVTARASPPPTWTERASVLAAPLFAALGVWWGLQRVSKGGLQ